MRKTWKVIIVTVITIIFSSFTVLASENIIPINELIDNGKEYDTKTITVQGEAIGELLERGENSFLNINDGTSAMGIFLRTEDGEMVNCYGDYHNIGDTVKVQGVFHRACDEHGGDMDIHCNSIELVSKGYGRTHKINKWKIISILLLSPCAVIGSINVYRILKKSDKKGII